MLATRSLRGGGDRVYTHPRSGGHCRSRYAFYWNGFLLLLFFDKFQVAVLNLNFLFLIDS